MECPYCGNKHNFSEPVPLCTGMPKNLGIKVPLIQQCLACSATLSPAAFRLGTPEHRQAKAAIRR